MATFCAINILLGVTMFTVSLRSYGEPSANPVMNSVSVDNAPNIQEIKVQLNNEYGYDSDESYLAQIEKNVKAKSPDNMNILKNQRALLFCNWAASERGTNSQKPSSQTSKKAKHLMTLVNESKDNSQAINKAIKGCKALFNAYKKARQGSKNSLSSSVYGGRK